MATRCIVGYETAAGEYVGVYCHNDSDPAYVVPILRNMSLGDVIAEVERGLVGAGVRQILHYRWETYYDAKGEHSLREDEVRTTWPASSGMLMYRKRLDGEVETLDGRGEPIVVEELPVVERPLTLDGLIEHLQALRSTIGGQISVVVEGEHGGEFLYLGKSPTRQVTVEEMDEFSVVQVDPTCVEDPTTLKQVLRIGC